MQRAARFKGESEMAQTERDFKGVWIPKEVWLDERLSALDKVILVDIDSLCSEERGCYASNKHIADFCQCSERKVTDAISKLVELGYLSIESFDGRVRAIKSNLTVTLKQTSNKSKASTQNNQGSIAESAWRNSKICEADSQNLRQSNKDSNKDSNSISPHTPLASEYRDEDTQHLKSRVHKQDPKRMELFERFWKTYPKKVSKGQALKTWEKLNPGEDLVEKIIKAVEYAKKHDYRFREERYTPNPSTWINAIGWEDSYTTPKEIDYDDPDAFVWPERKDE
jgi:hypothetical protein